MQNGESFVVVWSTIEVCYKNVTEWDNDGSTTINDMSM